MQCVLAHTLAHAVLASSFASEHDITDAWCSQSLMGQISQSVNDFEITMEVTGRVKIIGATLPCVGTSDLEAHASNLSASAAAVGGAGSGVAPHGNWEKEGFEAGT